MSKTVLYTSPYITVEYHEDAGLIHHTVHQPIADHFDILKEALLIGTDVLEKNGLTKWLSDDRNNGPLPPQAAQWGVDVWNKKTIDAGWKYWANVVPREIAAANSLTPLIENLYEFGLHMRVFTTVEEALEWLNSVE